MSTLIATTVVLACSAAAASPALPPDTPSVLFILVDDLGAMDIGAANPESFYETPNIDRLAASGMRFTNAYAACSVCSPTRASILTGRAPARLGITDYINPGGGNQPEKWGRPTPLLPAPYEDRLALEEVTLAEHFRAAGHATFFAGKWHLGPEGFFPEDQGFDVNRGGIARGGPYGGNRYFSPYGNERLEDGPEGEHLPARLARETVDFIEAQGDAPFLAYLSFYSVHTPLMAPEPLVEKYTRKRGAAPAGTLEERWRPEPPRVDRRVQDHPVYAGMVESMDSAVGVVLEALDRLERSDDTIVVFFSDNGGLSTSEGHPTSNAPLRAGKGWLYEGGIREPCIVRAPGVTDAGALCAAPIISMDFLPTLLELAGVPAASGPLDGRSFAPLLHDAHARLEREPLVWHYPHYGNQGASPSAAIRDGRWKLIEWFETGRLELFDLDADPEESRDLAVAEPGRAAALRERLHASLAELGAKMPTPNAARDPQRIAEQHERSNRNALEGRWR